jgi:hypothetical protein
VTRDSSIDILDHLENLLITKLARSKDDGHTTLYRAESSDKVRRPKDGVTRPLDTTVLSGREESGWESAPEGEFCSLVESEVGVGSTELFHFRGNFMVVSYKTLRGDEKLSEGRIEGEELRERQLNLMDPENLSRGPRPWDGLSLCRCGRC